MAKIAHDARCQSSADPREKLRAMSDLDFNGKTVLVVGGASGIGNGIAHAFRQRGAEVHVWGTRARPSDYRADEGSDLAGLHYAQLDVADFAAVESLQPPFQTLDVLVLCQGTVLYKRQEFAMSGFARVLDVNLHSVMACATRFREMLAASRGALVTVSSVAGYGANVGNPAYAASKAGVISLTRTLAVAWAGLGIRVNGIAPGLVDTKLTKVTTEHPDRLHRALAQIPVQRLGTPAEMAGAVLFLASPLAAYVCGQTLRVDGGLGL
jgi:3-oxoacyl-[acyl-carrier protein] reductase